MHTKRRNDVVPKARRYPLGLVLSGMANLLLLAGMAWLLWGARARTPVPVSPSVQKSSESSKISSAYGTDEAPHFSWDELQSLDFPTYISRLRGIHCPEPTLRSIIKGELDDIYADKRQELLVQHGETHHTPLSDFLRGEFDRLAREEDQLLAQLLRADAARAPASGIPEPSRQDKLHAAIAASRTSFQEGTQGPLTQPLIFQDVDTSNIKLNPSQQEVIDMLKQIFWAAIGGPNQNPSDPVYLQRWKRAQKEADLELRLQLGSSLYDQYQAASH